MKIYYPGLEDVDLRSLSQPELEELHLRLCLKPEHGGFKTAVKSDRDHVLDETKRRRRLARVRMLTAKEAGHPLRSEAG